MISRLPKDQVENEDDFYRIFSTLPSLSRVAIRTVGVALVIDGSESYASREYDTLINGEGNIVFITPL